MKTRSALPRLCSAVLLTTALPLLAQSTPPTTEPAAVPAQPIYQVPPGYKLVPIDTPPTAPAPAQPAPAPAPPQAQPAQPAPPPPSTYNPPPPTYNPAPSTYNPPAQPTYTYQPYQPPQPAPPVPVPVVINHLADQQIDQLTASIALYPDPLIADILPAASFPTEVGAAAQWCHFNPNAPEYAIQAQYWQPSVKALAHYPSVLDMMAGNPDWTQRLGAAFVNQPADVTNSIQRLRQEALAVGTLYSSPEQTVINDAGVIRVIPADPQYIYVPHYDPAVVYIRHDHPHTVITFGPRFGIGAWLNYDVDWHSHWVITGSRRWDPHAVHVDVRPEPWRRDVIIRHDDRFDHHDWDRHDDHRDGHDDHDRH